MVAFWPEHSPGAAHSRRSRCLAPLYVVAFLHVEVSDAAKRRGADIDIGLGLDLAGSADDRGQILRDNLGGQNLGVARLLLTDEDGNKTTGHNTRQDTIRKIFFMGAVVLQEAPVLILRNNLLTRFPNVAEFPRRMNP